MRYILPTLVCLTASAAHADMTVRFVESAPKDRFVISSSCTLSDVQMTIDLTGSAGALIFDVTAAGAGVEVFQPVEVQTGRATMAPVVDGDQVLSLQIAKVPNDAEVVISADLDDVLTQSALGQIRVAGSELDGAEVRIDHGNGPQSAIFADGTNTVRFSNGCLS